MNVSDGMKAENITVTQGLTRETAGGKIFGRGKGKKRAGFWEAHWNVPAF
jgi:hypothetical protein